MNNRFDEGEKPVEGVKFMANRNRAKAETDETGTALIDGLPVYQNVELEVSTESIPDPHIIPSKKGYRILMRPGAVAEIDFPLVNTGEVDGTIRWAGEEKDSGVSDVQVELLDSTGKVIQTTKSAFDGFYLFEFVPLGDYTVRVSPVQLARLSLDASPPGTVSLTKDEPVVAAQDFTIVRHQPSVTASVPPATASEPPRPAPGGGPRITSVRVGDHGATTRFVLEADEKLEFKIFTLASPYRVVIDLPEVSWRVLPEAGKGGRGLIDGLRFGLFAPGISRIVLDMRAPVGIKKSFMLSPADGHGYRLVIDLEKVSRKSASAD